MMTLSVLVAMHLFNITEHQLYARTIYLNFSRWSSGTIASTLKTGKCGITEIT